ncbi:hypothetical protein EC991_006623 [Linnemannia zychae]|nr:hypothetical protein EC991_006623 [Linnemannia zychae]
MVTINGDVILAILARSDILTVVRCREVSKRFKHFIDKELALVKADFSTLTFRQRRNITDSVMTRDFAHIFRRASIVNLDGTGIGHYGAVKFVTDYTKELHVERCPRVDLGKLIQAIAGDRWLSYDLDPVYLYTKTKLEERGRHDYDSVVKPLLEYSWAVILMSNDCRCRYVKVEEYQPTTSVICHACDKDVKGFTMDELCAGCGNPTYTGCRTKMCNVPNCETVLCKGCATENRCSLCHKGWCLLCPGEYMWVFQCYGCADSICDQCQPSNLTCSVEQYRQYCAQCVGAMEDKHDHWCCDTGNFEIKLTR